MKRESPFWQILGIQLQINNFLQVSSFGKLLKTDLYSTDPILLFLGTRVKLGLPATWYWVLPLKGNLKVTCFFVSLQAAGIFLKEAKD